MDLKKIGAQYDRPELKRETLKSSPIEQLEEWIELSITAKLPYANAAVLSTIDDEGFPSSRVILIKEIKNGGLIFFTNYHSDKARNIERDPKVSLNIYWKELDRQVRITGHASRIPAQESKDYFYSRPRESQISAVASDQSSIVTKEELHRAVEDLKKKCAGKDVPFPDYWGGFIVSPASIEFWQGRPSRLHDRFLYTKNSDGSWGIDRLAP